jgi:hypothetical protein
LLRYARTFANNNNNKMTQGNKKRRFRPSTAQSLLLGMGSIFSLASFEAPPTYRPAAQATRDAQALRGDWNRVGCDVRSSMDKIRKKSGIK